MRRVSALFCLALAMLGLWLVGGAEAGVHGVHRVAVFPMGVLEYDEGAVDVTAEVRALLEQRGVRVISPSELDDFLVARRIRKPKFMDRVALDALHRTLGVDALLLGYATVGGEDDNPQISVGGQLVACRDGSVVWANAVTRSGKEFASLLGLGRIGSLPELADVVLPEFFADLPSTMYVADNDPYLWTVIDTGLTPSVVQGGQEVSVWAKSGTSSLQVQSVSALLDGRDMALEAERDGVFRGTFLAPEEEGKHLVSLKMQDDAGNVRVLDGAVVLHVHNRAPMVSMICRGGVISPNGDGIKDSALCLPRVSQEVPLQKWQAQVMDSAGSCVRSETGLGSVPEAFEWRGDDGKGRPVADGNYALRLEVEDAAGNRAVASGGAIRVDTTPPEVRMALVDGEEGRIRVDMRVQDAGRETDWVVVLHAPDGTETQRIVGRGNAPNVLDVDAPPGAQAATLFYSVYARDGAGNSMELSKQKLRMARHDPAKTVTGRTTVSWVDDF